jgi:hypothetical protein
MCLFTCIRCICLGQPLPGIWIGQFQVVCRERHACIVWSGGLTLVRLSEFLVRTFQLFDVDIVIAADHPMDGLSLDAITIRPVAVIMKATSH